MKEGEEMARRRFRLTPFPSGMFIEKHPKDWSSRERSLFNRRMEQFQNDHLVLASPSMRKRYVDKWVAVFRGEVLAADKDLDKVLAKLEQLGGAELRSRCAKGFIHPPGTKFIL